MADKKLFCEVITPEKILYQGDVDMVIAPGTLGELGILPTHEPIITTLNIGELRLKRGSDQQDYIAIDGGYMEVNEDRVTILADAAEYASKMDIGELNKIKDNIENSLSAMTKNSEDFFAASAELERVTNRLRIVERRR